MAAHQRADDGAGEIERAQPADLFAVEVKRRRMLENAADSAGQRDFEAVDCPARTERKHDEPVKSAPRQAVESGGNVGADRFHRTRRLSMDAAPPDASTKQQNRSRRLREDLGRYRAQ